MMMHFFPAPVKGAASAVRPEASDLCPVCRGADRIDVFGGEPVCVECEAAAYDADMEAHVDMPTAVRTEPLVDLLPDTKSRKHAVCRWSASTIPGLGMLEILAGRNTTVYGVREVETSWPGRAFRLNKMTDGTDKDSSGYSVFVAADGSGHVCGCRGHAATNDCKHLQAVQTLLANRWV